MFSPIQLNKYFIDIHYKQDIELVTIGNKPPEGVNITVRGWD